MPPGIKVHSLSPPPPLDESVAVPQRGCLVHSLGHTTCVLAPKLLFPEFHGLPEDFFLHILRHLQAMGKANLFGCESEQDVPTGVKFFA